MAGISFTEGSGVNDSVFGKCQAPIRMFIEKRGEAFEQMSMLKHLFDINDSRHFGETISSMTAMKGFQPVGENGEYPADYMQEGHKKVLINMTWKDSFSLSREIIDDAPSWTSGGSPRRLRPATTARASDSALRSTPTPCLATPR